MSRRASAAAAAPLVGVGAALAFSAATATTWVREPVARTIGDAAVDEVVTTTGTQLVPLAIVAGLAALLCGLAMLVTRGMARRIVALLLTVSGICATVAATFALIRAFALDGGLTAAVWIAPLAAVVVTAAGMLGLGAPARRLPARYDVGVDPTDREWRMAADDDDARSTPDGEWRPHPGADHSEAHPSDGTAG